MAENGAYLGSILASQVCQRLCMIILELTQLLCMPHLSISHGLSMHGMEVLKMAI